MAIFDFDGTLYKKETFSILMSHLKNHPIYYPEYKGFFRAILPMYIAYKLKLYPEKKMKEQSMRLYLKALKKLSKAELHTYFKELAEEMRADFNPDIVRRLEQHIADDFHVMLVSGAFTQLIESATEEFDFDTIIGTEIPIAQEQIDMNAPIHHIRGQRKTSYILRALADYNIDWGNSFAYGDSYSDLPVLELVGHPVAIQPEKKLRSIAKEREWEIL